MPNTDIMIFCTKCREKTSSNDAKNVTTKNGRPGTQAVCAVCSTKKFLIGKHVAA